MQRIPVESHSLKTLGYDPERRILEVEFRRNGQIYKYFDVPAEEYEAFLRAESKGTYLNQQFKARGYCCVQVERRQP
jgi:hypothetical protein